MHYFTNWMGGLDLASRVSSILLKLCTLEVFLLFWPGPLQSSSLGSSPGKHYSGPTRNCPCYCIRGHFLWLAVMQRMKGCLCNLVTIQPPRIIMDSAMASKILKKILTPKKLTFFTLDVFHPKKTHGLLEEPNTCENSKIGNSKTPTLTTLILSCDNYSKGSKMLLSLGQIHMQTIFAPKFFEFFSDNFCFLMLMKECVFVSRNFLLLYKLKKRKRT